MMQRYAISTLCFTYFSFYGLLLCEKKMLLIWSSFVLVWPLIINELDRCTMEESIGKDEDFNIIKRMMTL
jgi:hypothetical protein